MTELALFNILLLIQFGAAVLVFILLFWISAPYGRHLRSGWGPTLPARPAWLVMELPAVATMPLLFGIGNRRSDPVALLFLIIWQVHYLQRVFIFPFLMRAPKKPFPLLVMNMAFLFNTLNGYLNGRYLFALAPSYPLSWLADFRFLTGTALFLIGYLINLHSDHVLRRLRPPGERGYRIPRRGLFRYLSCPNYFGEILEWSGWAIATWSLPGLAFATFTTANLLPRALAHNRWYRDKFPNYPRNRKALIPFLL